MSQAGWSCAFPNREAARPPCSGPCNPMALAVDDSTSTSTLRCRRTARSAVVRKMACLRNILDRYRQSLGLRGRCDAPVHLRNESRTNRARAESRRRARGPLASVWHGLHGARRRLGLFSGMSRASSDSVSGNIRMNRVPRTGGVTEQLVQPPGSIDGRVTAGSDFVVSGVCFGPRTTAPQPAR